jgi:two-component system response regulator AtoC
VRPVGASRVTNVDVRVIAATHRDLERAVREGHFRQDLFYRLHVFAVHVPPLRERRADVPLLATHFLATFRAKGRGAATLTADALEALAGHEWPGNVRELENTLERLVVEARGGTIDVPDLPPAFRERPAALEAPLFTGLPSLEEMEKRYLRHVLAEVKGNRSRAAEVLGIDRRTLYRMAGRFGLDLGEDDPR